MLEFELVVPAYNEAASLPALIRKTINAARSAGFTAERFQLVIVDNGSTDNTRAYFLNDAESAEKNWYRVISVPVNRGYGAGLKSGLATTTAPIVGYSHADLQCDPADAFRAANVCQSSGAKSFVRSRREGRNPRDQLVSYTFAKAAQIVLGLQVDEINAQPKVFNRALLRELDGAPTDFAFDIFVLYRATKLGYAFKTLPVQFPPRVHGTSKWAATVVGRYGTFAKMAHYMWKLRRESGPLC